MSKKERKRSFFTMNTVTSCISTTLVLLLLGTVVLFVLTSSHLSNRLKENFFITIMLDDNLKPTVMKQMEKKWKAEPCVRTLVYISKEKALEEQTKAMGTDPTEFLGSNPLPASFELHLNGNYANTDSLKHIIPRLKSEPFVVEVTYPHELMESVNQNIRKTSMFLLMVALLLTFVSFELINNTIRLSVYSRRFLIHTMKLVGASWSFIRRPFLWQAFWIGMLSASVATALLFSGVTAVTDYEPEMAVILTGSVLVITAGVVYGCGLVLTLLCACFSVNRHLRMKANKLYTS